MCARDDEAPLRAAVAGAETGPAASPPRTGGVTAPAADPTWLVEVRGDDPPLRRVHESLLTLADGRFGTRGTPEEDGAGYEPMVMAAGVFDVPRDGDIPRPLPGPAWFSLDVALEDTADERRIVDLRDGLLHRIVGDGRLRSVRFASLDRPGVCVSRVEHDGAVGDGDPLATPVDAAHTERGESGGVPWVRVTGEGGIAAAVSTDRRRVDGVTVVDRIAVLRGDPRDPPDPAEVVDALVAAREHGVDALLADHRRAWRHRWEHADVRIDGDPSLERAVRFGLFHLIASAADRGEAAVGARGMTGEAYAGHVFWDTDVFVLPFLAATHPASSRAVLEYRVRRLGPARERAATEGREGVRFPWESAADGREVTPDSTSTPHGGTRPILTGEQEEHITADVAWAAWHHAHWTGDTGFLTGPGRPLVVEAARYWASRIEVDADGRGHVTGVIGPDEYHETVDDNAYTNVMARWNLRRGAELLDRDGPAGRATARRWRVLADRVVDGHRPTGGHEQFAGYDDLEPLLVRDIGAPPLAADMIMGQDRLARSQVIKQPDVLMLHHLVPDELAPGSLAADLDHYLPRTAHGSSLSPAISASLLARVGRPEEALDLLRLAAEIDLSDSTGTTAGGLHLATMGGVWQALAFGFLGLSPRADVLRVAPASLPAQWRELELRVRFHGDPVTVRLGHDHLSVEGTGSVRVVVEGLDGPPTQLPLQLSRDGERWRRETPWTATDAT